LRYIFVEVQEVKLVNYLQTLMLFKKKRDV